jgi:hypothetical protein
MDAGKAPGPALSPLRCLLHIAVKCTSDPGLRAGCALEWDSHRVDERQRKQVRHATGVTDVSYSKKGSQMCGM